jgi:AraC-like DNA-binding protein
VPRPTPNTFQGRIRRRQTRLAQDKAAGCPRCRAANHSKAKNSCGRLLLPKIRARAGSARRDYCAATRNERTRQPRCGPIRAPAAGSSADLPALRPRKAARAAPSPRSCGSVSAFPRAGRSSLQCVTRERITRAQQRPGFQTKLSLIEIALEVGYTSPSAFAQVFRRVIGVTQTEFRGAS